jgi:hypothetical protein
MLLTLTDAGKAALANTPGDFTRLQVEILCRSVNTIHWLDLLHKLGENTSFSGVSIENMSRYVSELCDRKLLRASDPKAPPTEYIRRVTPKQAADNLPHAPHPPSVERSALFASQLSDTVTGFATADECKARTGMVNMILYCVHCKHHFYDHGRERVSVVCPFCHTSQFTERS